MRQGRHGVEPGLHGPGRHSIPGGLTAARACAKGGHATIADAFFRQPGPPTVPGDQARRNQMKRARIATGVLTATLLATAMPAAAFAMPGDIEEAVTQQGYNAYEYQSSDAAYDDSELLAVEGDYVATANAMIRQSPFGTIPASVSTSSCVVTSVPASTEIRVTGNVLNTDWYQCEYDGRTVYAFDDYLKPEFPQTMACNVPALNIREAADINANVIGTLTTGDKVKVSADENDWLRFEMEDGRIGYVWDEYMEAVGQ